MNSSRRRRSSDDSLLQSPYTRRGRPSDSGERIRLQNPDPSYRDSNEYPKIKDRGTIHHSVKFNGDPSDWPRVDILIQQHFGQHGCEYLTNPRFLETYLNGGYEACMEKNPYLYLNYPQLVSDNSAFYFALSSVMYDKCMATVMEYGDGPGCTQCL